MIRAVVQQQTQSSVVGRKLGKDVMNRMAESASLVQSLLEEVQQNHDIQKDELSECFVDLFVNGDVNLDVELQTAIHEKDPNFGISNISSLDRLINSTKEKIAMDTPEATIVSIKAAELEAHEWELERAKLEFDRNAYCAWRQKCQERAANVFHKKFDVYT